ncbi:MAG: hypothetical protein M1823_004396 [Watsoniomyces obsoletus]|nr:MAG: hypothetical protein M1823_004396 [Watsoniomyces obsoletus]
MPMNWTPQEDSRMLGHVLRLHDFKVDYEGLAEAMGSECTAKALKNRIGKLKSISAGGTNDSATNNDESAPTSPVKSKASGRGKAAAKNKDTDGTETAGKVIAAKKTTGAKAKATGRKRNAQQMEAADNNDDDAVPTTSEKVETALVAKAENEDSDNNGDGNEDNKELVKLDTEVVAADTAGAAEGSDVETVKEAKEETKPKAKRARKTKAKDDADSGAKPKPATKRVTKPRAKKQPVVAKTAVPEEDAGDAEGALENEENAPDDEE